MSRRKVFLTRNGEGYLVKASEKNAPVNSFNCTAMALCRRASESRVWSVEALQKRREHPIGPSFSILL